jgi:hypothetical protein
MDTIIKVMGLPRSGTNAMNVLSNLNFDHYVCDRQKNGMDFLGWKHALPMDFHATSIVEKRCGIDVKFIFCYRDFTEWHKAIINRYYNQDSTEFRPYSFGNDGFIFNTPVGVEFYDNIYDYWSKYVDAYKIFCESYSDKAILIEYNELFDQQKLLDKLKTKLNLTQSFDDFTFLRKKVTFDNILTHIKS